MVVVKQRVEKKGVVVAAEIRRSVVFVAQGWITLSYVNASQNEFVSETQTFI